jgi:hypothetical protein
MKPNERLTPLDLVDDLFHVQSTLEDHDREDVEGGTEDSNPREATKLD